MSGVQLNYTMGPRRPGDIVAIYANNEKAVTELGWNCQYNLDDMMSYLYKEFYEKKNRGFSDEEFKKAAERLPFSFLIF